MTNRQKVEAVENLALILETLKRSETDSAAADRLRSRFGGAKFMLEVLEGRDAKADVLAELRRRGIGIPHTSQTGFDSDSDFDL